MAKFVILIYGDEQQWAAMSPQEQRKLDEVTRPAGLLYEVSAGHSGVEIREIVNHG